MGDAGICTRGVNYYLCRDNLPEVYGKYPEWTVRLKSLEEDGKGLAGRHYPPDHADSPSVGVMDFASPTMAIPPPGR